MSFRRLSVAMFVLAVLIVPYEAAFGQSFNCQTARLQAEKAICSGPRLIQLDERLAQSYGRLKSSLPKGRQQRPLIRAQRNWLRARNQCKSNRRCLRSQYNDRIAQVEGLLEGRERKLALEHPGPSFDCRQAKRAAAVTICRYRQISNLDRRLDGIYRAALMKSRSNSDRRNLRLNQAQWINARNFCRFDRACLRRSYNNRIGYLSDIVADLGQRPNVRPSFDCGYAKLASEKAICTSQRLAKLDVEGDNLFKRATQQAPSKVMRDDLRTSETDWLRTRNRCRSNRGCLADSYSSRIVYLENMLYYFGTLVNAGHQGPNFECTTVRNGAERMICARKNLSRLDRQLAGVYGVLKKDIPKGGRSALRKAQSGWLVGRNNCGEDAKCLRRKYKTRIFELEAQHDEIRSAAWQRPVKVEPSFSCRHARRPAETTICDNGVLAQLDREMASTYYALRDATTNARKRGQLKYKQKVWLTERNNCGYRVNCLRDKYETRLYQLERALDG